MGRKRPVKHTVHTRHPKYNVPDYLRGKGSCGGIPVMDGSGSGVRNIPESSQNWINKWLSEKEKYERLGTPLSKLKMRISRHRANLILGRDFGESVDSFLERRGLKEYYQWKPDF